MKMGKFEGTIEEINGLAEVTGRDLSELLELPKQPPGTTWLVVPVLCAFACVIALLFISESFTGFRTLVFLLGFASCLWEAIMVHQKTQNQWAAFAITFCGLLIMLVALGILEPVELIDHTKGTLG